MSKIKGVVNLKNPITVGVLVYDDVDLLDVTGPIEVFNAVREATEPAPQDPVLELYNTEPLFDTITVSVFKQETIQTADGLKIKPDTYREGLSDLDKFRIWVIPGGKGAHIVRKDNQFIHWLTKAIERAHISLSVCTGAYICAETGYLDNEIVATHWKHLDVFQQEFPHLKLANNARYMEGFKLVTTGGVTAGIDGALYLVKTLISEYDAQKAAQLINYPWLG